MLHKKKKKKKKKKHVTTQYGMAGDYFVINLLNVEKINTQLGLLFIMQVSEMTPIVRRFE